LAERLEEPVPRGRPDVERKHHRLVDQAIEQVHHVELIDAIAGTDRLDALQVETPAEHREPVEQRLLLARQEVIRPVDGGEQCLMALAGGAAVSGEEPEPLAEATEDLRREHRPRAGCGKQHGERDAVELLADRDDVLVVHGPVDVGPHR
jgi:hypothetical protein